MFIVYILGLNDNKCGVFYKLICIEFLVHADLAGAHTAICIRN